jgi:hypothetical protein
MIFLYPVDCRKGNRGPSSHREASHGDAGLLDFRGFMFDNRSMAISVLRYHHRIRLNRFTME